jgi:hypothetical protein
MGREVDLGAAAGRERRRLLDRVALGELGEQGGRTGRRRRGATAAAMERPNSSSRSSTEAEVRERVGLKDGTPAPCVGQLTTMGVGKVCAHRSW